jgi:succinyl-diaminopimelate desuccinylase
MRIDLSDILHLQASPAVYLPATKYIMTNLKTALLKAMQHSQDSQVQLLQSFVKAPSPNPPGNTTEAAAVLTNYFSSKGIPHELIDPQGNGQPNIVSEFQGGAGDGPRVVLNGHIDVFPVGDGSGWTRDPWSGDVVNGRVHGRGVVDMKSGTASLVIAYATLYEKRQSLRGSVALCAVSDEETGGKYGTKYLIAQDKQRWGGDVMLSTEPGGCESVRFAEKGTLRLSGTVKTSGAHGAYLNLSKGAIRTATGFLGEMVDKVEAMPVNLPPEMAEHIAKPEVQKAIDAAMGPGTAAIIARPTVNIGTIKGGLKVNMIPDTCVFELDIRLPVGLLAEEVLAVIDSITPNYKDAAITIEKQAAASNPYSFSSLHHPIVGHLADNAQELQPSWDRPVPIPSMGATDCKHYRYAGVPAYVFGCSPKTSKSEPAIDDGFSPHDNTNFLQVASVNESASVDEFLHVTQVIAGATWDFLQQE